MNLVNITLAGALLATMPLASAQSTPKPASHLHAQHATPTSSDVPAAAHPAVDTVTAFGTALAAGDFAEVERLLDPAVIILESGGAERSRAEYLGHHAQSDARFLAAANVIPVRRVARVDGALAWVASEGETHANRNGVPMTLLSTETMVLAKSAEGWRIVHVHWSSRPMASGGAQ